VSDDEQRFESRATDRLVAFSDAVVAIAITLLALDLPVPTGATMSAFSHSVRHNDEHYLAFLISFFVIAAAWRRYHHVYRYIERVDQRLVTYNLLWLLIVILTPFATKLLTSPGQSTIGPHALQFGFYALLQVVSSAALLLTVHHVAAHSEQASGTPPLADTYSDWASYGAMLGFVLSIPFFFVFYNAWVLWFAIPLVVGRLASWQRRRRGHAGGHEAT
jgi:uncharacterized membrane protein